MSEQRKIRFNGKEQGPHSLDELYRMAKRKEIDHNVEFLSEITDDWLPLVGIMEDFNPSRKKLERLRAIGIKTIGIIGAEYSCPVCLSLCAKVFPIDNVPALPPEGCTCFPWCRLSIGAVG